MYPKSNTDIWFCISTLPGNGVLVATFSVNYPTILSNESREHKIANPFFSKNGNKWFFFFK